VPSNAFYQINDLHFFQLSSAPTWRVVLDWMRYGSAICVAHAIPAYVLSENPMSFMNSTALDDLARRLAESVPESVRAFGRDLEGNFKAVLQAQLAKLDLVSRQEFDVQAAVLARTQAQLSELGERLQQIEAKLSPQPQPQPQPPTTP